MFSIKNGIAASLTAATLTACTPSVVSLQPIGAPDPENSEMTFVDADGCRWWVIGNVTNLSWAPMTNSVGEHVCEGMKSTSAAAETVETMNEAIIDEPFAVVVDTPTVAETPAIAATPTPVPTVATSPTPEVRPTFANTTYFVQVASFAQKANAEASERVFAARGLPISSGSNAQDGGLYRLVLGPFSTESGAAAARLAANTEGFADAFSFKR